MKLLSRTASRALFRFITCLFVVALVGNEAHAYQQQNLKLSEVYRQLLDSKESTFSYNGVEVVNDFPDNYDGSRDFKEDLEALLSREIELVNGVIPTKVESLEFKNISGELLQLSFLKIDQLRIEHSQVEKLELSHAQVGDFSLYDSKFDQGMYLNNLTLGEYIGLGNEFLSINIEDSEFTEFLSFVLPQIKSSLYVSGSTFKQGAYLSAEFMGLLKDVILEYNVFEAIDSREMLELADGSSSPQLFLTQLSLDFSGGLSQMIIENNEFKADLKEQLVFIKAEVDYFDIGMNLFESSFFPDAVVKNQFNFTENESLGYLLFDKLILEGKNNRMYWEELNGFRLSGSIYEGEFAAADEAELGMTYQERLDYFKQNQEQFNSIFRGETDEELKDDREFQNLISTYYRLYKVFKENGQIKEANKTYIEMKDLEARQLSYLYDQEGGVENFLTWRLNSLLKIYTGYGTNPSRAIRISIYVILAFSIFYFLYPSEWDLKSKKQLVDDYRAFVDKNDQGYLKPFFKLFLGFGASLINAMTLSLNAFVTLGFGSIPTLGLARYICIIEGFIGWFLLSIFTASLINQILF